MKPLPAEGGKALREAIATRLEAIIDPCSVASNVPAGLVSMGLVRDIEIDERPGGARVRVTLCITEPGCMMGAIFSANAQRALAALPGVAEAEVRVDYSYVWDREDLAPEYRRRLDKAREQRLAHMKALQLVAVSKQRGG